MSTHKLVWLQKVACDPKMRGLPCGTAVLLALRYFNPDTGKAWPSQKRLATELGCATRNLQHAIDRLVEAGWLARKTNGKGRGQRNQYWIPKGVASDARERKDVPGNRKDVAGDVKKDVAKDVTEKGKNIKGREGGRSAPPQDPHDDSSPRKKKGSNGLATRFPRSWDQLDRAQLKEAADLAGWDQQRAASEFERFQGYYRDRKPTRSKSWPAEWRNWCHNGRRYDERDAAKPRRETGFRSAVRGLQGWLDVMNDDE